MNLQQDPMLYDFNQIYKEMDDLYHAVARKLQLSDSAFEILYSICVLGNGCLQKDICKLTYTSKQTVNSSIRKLEQQNYIVLRPGKGRDMHIFLTEAGQALAQEKIIPVIQLENQAFTQMTPAEQSQLLQLSKQYLFNLQQKLQQLL